MGTRSMICFDWAMKHQLCHKKNFSILEGFLSELLRKEVIIKQIVKSDENRKHEFGRFNQVEILAEMDKQEFVIIELQYGGIADYYYRMRNAISKSAADFINKGAPYSEVRKAYSVNIVYFELEAGYDYIYHGTITKFTGLHTQNELHLKNLYRRICCTTLVGDFNPEYYIIATSEFNCEPKDTLDEWIYYLTNSKIKDNFTAKGINKARRILSEGNLTDEEKHQEWRCIHERRIKDSEIETAILEGERARKAEEEAGLKKGEAIGLEKGEAKVLEQIVINGKNGGLSLEQTQLITKLSIEQITKILKRNNLL